MREKTMAVMMKIKGKGGLRFEVTTTVSVKMLMFWDVMPNS
jgi:hypothetical protein